MCVNREVLRDLFDTHDNHRNVSVWLNIVCNGTAYKVACHVREGNGPPTSRKRFMKFKTYRVNRFSCSEVVTCDRGLNHGGNSRKALLVEGVYMSNTALEAPEQLCRCERRGKKLYKPAPRAHKFVGKQKAKDA